MRGVCCFSAAASHLKSANLLNAKIIHVDVLEKDIKAGEMLDSLLFERQVQM